MCIYIIYTYYVCYSLAEKGSARDSKSPYKATCSFRPSQGMWIEPLCGPINSCGGFPKLWYHRKSYENGCFGGTTISGILHVN